MNLTSKKCIPCEVGGEPLSDSEENKYLVEASDWQIDRSGTHKIAREFKFKDFKEAMAFVDKVAGIAESEGHHPDIYIYYNKVRMELYSHAVGGLSENDFIVAAKISAVEM